MNIGDPTYIRRFFSVYSTEEKDKVRGHAFFPSDYIHALLPEGVAHVFVVRSPHASASFSTIKTQKALARSGVLKIITAGDVPNNIPFGKQKKKSQLILAEERVRFVGEPVALVVAETRDQARDAANFIEIDWKLEEGPAEQSVESLYFKQGTRPDKTLKYAESSFRFPSLHARYLEPESGWLALEGDRFKFHIGSLLSESQRLWVADVLGIPYTRVEAEEAYLGGQFGGRQQREMIAFLALASFISRRSCALMLEYEEQDVGSYGYSGSLRIGYDPKSGILEELSGELRIDAGSYEGNAAAVLQHALEHATCAYSFNYVELEGEVLLSPTHPRRALRGEGVTAITWVTEQLIEEIARELDVPSLELRAKIRTKDESSSMDKVFAEAERVERPFRLVKTDRNRPAWDAKLIEGRGFAFQRFQSTRASAFDSLDVSIELLSNGSFVIRVSNHTLDLHIKSALCEVAAQVLHTHPKAFTVFGEMRKEFEQARKRETYPEFYYLAQATWYAADRLRQRIKEVGARVFRVNEVELQDGAVSDPQSTRKMGYRELAFTNSREEFKVSYTLENLHRPHGCSGGAVSRVSFHPLTGELRVESVKVVIDAGPVVHRTGLEIEAESAVAWAMAALFCSTVERDQPIPTPVDGPEEVILFPVEYPMQSFAETPAEFFGARGLPDVMHSVVLASLVNAIHDARGTPLREIPMLPSFIYPEKKTTNNVHMMPLKR